MRRRFMPWAAMTVMTLGAALSVTACSSTKDDAPRVAGAKDEQEQDKPASQKEIVQAYEKCLHEQGFMVSIDESGRFKDPGPDNPNLLIQKGLPAAANACRAKVPGMKQVMEKDDKEGLEQARGLAKCLRENGIPNVSDPDPKDGGLSIPADAGDAWNKAMGMCGKKFPNVPLDAAGSQ
ncbi:hypothetical protein ACIGXA_33805 [Streptomyces fildesensis]|uniref:Lipoprotein n=1 Tax=Streptomyces fildesensis TaxID=375757 RepID=A0ABW8CJE5_9ACTN